jgi:excisionase family DNA binding protein
MAPKVETDELLTVAQAAKLLNISAAAIHKAIKRDRLAYIKLGGRFFIRRADLIQYSRNKSVGGRPKKQG